MPDDAAHHPLAGPHQAPAASTTTWSSTSTTPRRSSTSPAAQIARGHAGPQLQVDAGGQDAAGLAHVDVLPLLDAPGRLATTCRPVTACAPTRYTLIHYYGKGMNMKGAKNIDLPPEWELFDLQKRPAADAQRLQRPRLCPGGVPSCAWSWSACATSSATNGKCPCRARRGVLR